MSSIQYGSYSLPNPQPFITVDPQPIFIRGKVDHVLNRITLIGTLTGNNLYDVNSEKRRMISGLSSEYLSLDLIDKTFNCCKPVGISFDSSNLSSIQPYSIEFESFEDTAFSSFFGVTDPTNTWSYSEQQGRIVQASHSVSAIGVKTSTGSSPFNAAKAFVEANLNGFENLSLLLSGQQGILISKKEDIDQNKGSYSVVEDYSFSTSSDPIQYNGIVSASSKINYSNENGLQASIDGSIIGEFGGSTVSTGDFTSEDAMRIIMDAVIKSKSNFESGVYAYILRGPSSYNYNVDSGANKIDFSFDFKDPDRYSEFKDDVKISVSASKDSSLYSVSVAGNLSYMSIEDGFTGSNILESPRWIKLEEEFAKINPYSHALEAYLAFRNTAIEYDDGDYLNPTPKTESITKSPYEPSISYNYSYTNERDLNPDFKNLNISFTDNKARTMDGVLESTDGFSIINGTVRKLGTIQATFSSESPSGSLSSLIPYSENFIRMKKPTCAYTEKSSSQNSDAISYSFGGLYYEP